MKKILILLLMLLIPITVKAELQELKLLNQYNTGYSETYYAGDYFFLRNDIYDPDNNYTFAAMDLEGNYIYEHKPTYASERLLFDYENVYSLSGYSGSGIRTVILEKYDAKTGELLSDLAIANVEHEWYSFKLIRFEGYIGIEYNRYERYIIKDDLSTYERVDDFNSYNSINIKNPYTNYLDWNESTDLHDFLEENHIDLDTISNYQVLIGNYYYLLPYTNGEIKSNIIMVDKNLKDYDIIPIQNGKIYDGTKYSGDYLNYLDLVENNGKLVLIFQYAGSCPGAHSALERFGSACDTNSYVQIYKPVYNIYTKTDGNGEIEVSQGTADTGEGVTFEIIPNEGYTLGEVKVTDADGNVIKFTDYKFTMPSADVTIEAKFVKAAVVPINPNTGDAIITGIVILLISLIAVILIKYKEKKLS